MRAMAAFSGDFVKKFLFFGGGPTIKVIKLLSLIADYHKTQWYAKIYIHSMLMHLQLVGVQLI